MPSHADRIREAERAVVEAAVAYWALMHNDTPDWDADSAAMDAEEAAVDALLALRAATCPACGGTGGEEYENIFGVTGVIPCPSGCDAGRKVPR